MIYFVQANKTNLVKIGYTASAIKQRIDTLQTGSPEDLRLLGMMPGEKEDEQSLHHRFGESRERGEWFRPTLPLLRFIEANAYLWTDAFSRLVEIEPALGSLFREAKQYHASTDPDFCANAVWYGYFRRPSIKQALLRLVGWQANNPTLKTSAAYDIAYEAVYDALPDCRGKCACTRIMEACIGVSFRQD